MALVDLDDEFLQMLYNLTGSEVPKNVELADLKKQLGAVVDSMKELSKVSKRAFKSNLNEESEEEDDYTPSILVVDDLGVITYQLRVLLSKLGYNIDCSQEIYDAVNKFKKKKYSYVVMDLFIPTAREGFILLTELKKIAAMNNVETVIGVITASPRKEIEQQCKEKGADFFLEKNNDWQNQLCTIMSEYIQPNGEDGDDF